MKITLGTQLTIVSLFLCLATACSSLGYDSSGNPITSLNVSNNFTGPQGATGATGAQGIAGTNGTNGINGADALEWWALSLYQWSSSVNGSGSLGNSNLFDTLSTGTTPNSVALSYYRHQGFNMGGSADSFDFGRSFKYEYKLSSYDLGNATSIKQYCLQLASGVPAFNTTATNLTQSGIGIQIVGHNLYAESYGTTLNYTSLNYTFSNYCLVGLKIDKEDSYIAYYLDNGAGYYLALNMTTLSAIPTSAGSTAWGVGWVSNYGSSAVSVLRVYEPRFWQGN